MDRVVVSAVRCASRTGAVLVALGIAAAAGAAQESLPHPWASPRATFSQRVGITDVTVDAGRPAVKGRKIWGHLVPWGEVWRAGANENTTLRCSSDIQVEGQPLAAGLYGLHMIPEQDHWTVIFSRNATSWGSFSYTQAEDALRVEVKAEDAPLQEWLGYDFDDLSDTGATLRLRWEKLAVPVRITVNTPQVVLDHVHDDYLRGVARFTWQGWNNAAAYCLQQELNLDEALQWSQRSVAMEEHFSNLWVNARLLDVAGKSGEAQATRDRALALGTESEINAAGYQALQGGGPNAIDAAFELFARNADRFPDSWNVWDSLAEAHQAKGDKSQAIDLYRKALAMAPPDQHARITGALQTLGTP